DARRTMHGRPLVRHVRERRRLAVSEFGRVPHGHDAVARVEADPGARKHAPQALLDHDLRRAVKEPPAGIARLDPEGARWHYAPASASRRFRFSEISRASCKSVAASSAVSESRSAADAKASCESFLKAGSLANVASSARCASLAACATGRTSRRGSRLSGVLPFLPLAFHDLSIWRTIASGTKSRIALRFATDSAFLSAKRSSTDEPSRLRSA